MEGARQFFDQLDYWIFRLLLLANLLITAYRVLDNEVHIGRFLWR